jgi:hypothetical protein
MSEIKHTPWHVTAPTDSMHAVRNMRGGIVADVGYSATLQENDVNARLIAAAPELLEALKLMVDDHFPDLPLGEQALRLTLADAAIAKATGSKA